LKTNSPNILIVTSEFPPQPGGIGNHTYNLARYLKRNDYDVTVITDQRSVSGEEEAHFDRTLMFNVYRIIRRKLRWLMYINRINLLFIHIQKSHVVIASGKFPLWIVAFSSLFYKRKFIAVIHGTEVNFKDTFLKFTISKALQRFSKIIAVSNHTKSLVSHLNLKSVVVIPNGFDNSKWKLEILIDEHLRGNPKLITVGNVTERKGQLIVIKQLP